MLQTDNGIPKALKKTKGLPDNPNDMDEAGIAVRKELEDAYAEISRLKKDNAELKDLGEMKGDVSFIKCMYILSAHLPVFLNDVIAKFMSY